MSGHTVHNEDHHRLNKIKRWFAKSFYSEYFTDALRNTLTIVFPVVLLFYMGFAQAGIGIGIGTLLISLTDLPGNRGDKFRTAFVSVPLFFFTSVLVVFSLPSTLGASLCITVLTFCFTMMTVLGPRMGLVGLMNTVLAVLILGVHPQDPFYFSLYIVSGGIWYYLISLLQIWIRPYRSIQHALHECLDTTASLLRIRAGAYDPLISLDSVQQENIRLHLELHNRQEQVRSLMLTDERLMASGNRAGKQLLAVSQDIIDLYEQVTAIHYDYTKLRIILGELGVLEKVNCSLHLLADALQICRSSFLRNHAFFKMRPILKEANASIDHLEHISRVENSKPLKKVVENLNKIRMLINRISAPKIVPGPWNGPMERYYLEFVSVENVNWTGFKMSFSIQQPIFRFALRLSVLCVVAAIANLWIPTAHYGYWLLMTVVVVNRPSFGLTWERNRDRLFGTVFGLIIGVLLIEVITPSAPQFIISMLALFGFFVFSHTRYDLSVGCITIMVVLCLNSLRGNPELIIIDRLLFTVVGCGLSFFAAFLFPIWEATRIKMLIGEVLNANINYLSYVLKARDNDYMSLHQIRLARKAAYLKFAAFSEALQSLKKEPRSKTFNMERLSSIQILCYQISTRTAARPHPKDEKELSHEQELILEEMEACVLLCANLDPAWAGHWKLEALCKGNNLDDDLLSLVLKLKMVLSFPGAPEVSPLTSGQHNHSA